MIKHCISISFLCSIVFAAIAISWNEQSVADSYLYRDMISGRGSVKFDSTKNHIQSGDLIFDYSLENEYCLVSDVFTFSVPDSMGKDVWLCSGVEFRRLSNSTFTILGVEITAELIRSRVRNEDFTFIWSDNLGLVGFSVKGEDDRRFYLLSSEQGLFSK